MLDSSHKRGTECVRECVKLDAGEREGGRPARQGRLEAVFFMFSCREGSEELSLQGESKCYKVFSLYSTDCS